MSEHIKSPWTYAYDVGSSDWHIDDADGKHVATVWNPDDDKAPARVRLIAAAPELLEMLSLYVAAEVACAGDCAERSERCVDCCARALLARIDASVSRTGTTEPPR